MSPLKRTLALCFAVTAAACSSPGYDEEWGGDLVADGRADGLGDDAIPIEFAKAKTGTVNEQSLVLYKIGLKKGDKFTATMNTTKGDLSPDLTLFFSLSTKVSSKTFDAKKGKLIKTYEIAASGTHFIAARAFQNKGAGSYSIALTCTGGPCKGEFEDEPLEIAVADECIGRARKCAFKAASATSGTITNTKATALFETCLGELGTDDGASCATACDDDPDDTFSAKPSEVCAGVIADIPFFAKKPAACLAELDGCLTSCAEFAEEIEDDIFEAPFARCWVFGFNNTCPGFARDHEACGGSLTEGSTEACVAECKAVDGAWADDLDGICAEICQ